MAEINIDRIGGTGGGPTPLPLGNLKVDNPLSTTLQIVKDTGGNASALYISTIDVTNFGGGAIASNTAFGINALTANTTGSDNSATLANNIIIADGSGNRRINVDSSGNVGIGTNAPSARLQIQGDGTNDIARFFNGDPIKTVFISNRGEIGAKSEFAGDGGFVGYNGNFGVQVFGLKRNSVGGLAVQSLVNVGFSVNGANSVSSYEMELTDTGNLIIGGSSGTARLAVKGSGTTSATTSLLVQNSAGTEVLKVTDDSVTNARGVFNVLHPSVATRSLKLGWGSIFATDSGSELTIGAVYSVPSSPQILLAGNARGSGANTMQLQASAGVSIATSLINPSAQLHVKGSGTTSATTALLVQNSAGAQNFKVADNGSVQIGTFNFVSSTVIENTTTRLVATTGGVAVNSSYAFANSSSILDVASTTKGFLPPRMTTAQKNAIATPAAGLMVYDTNLNKLCVYTTAWEIITSA
jgi:hypothetical protein